MRNSVNLTRIEQEEYFKCKKIIEDFLTSDDLCDNDIKVAMSKILSLGKPSSFGLHFERYKESIEDELNNGIPVPSELYNLRIVNGGSPVYLMEGDNLLSLSVLNSVTNDTGKFVDVIYIDPPYVAGKNDFTYDDEYIDSSDTFKHSKWLSFMDVRIRSAKKILKRHGIMFISIDENEYANIKLLCDDIFDESNYIGSIIHNKCNTQNDAKNIQKNHDYILIYANEKRDFDGKEISLLRSSNDLCRRAYKDEDGYYIKATGITSGNNFKLKERPNLGWSIYINHEIGDVIGKMDYDIEKAKVSNDEAFVYSTDESLIKRGYDVIRPPKRGAYLGRWTWSCDKFNQEFDTLIFDRNNKSGEYVIYKRVPVPDESIIVDGEKIYSIASSTSPSPSIISYSSVEAGNDLENAIGARCFNNPKSVGMIKYILGLIPNKNATILDFFAGSGTTAQAVIELNAEDGGNRSCFLCTNNEVSRDKKIKYFIRNELLDKEPRKTDRVGHARWVESFNALCSDSVILSSDEFQSLGLCRSITYNRIKSILTGEQSRGSKKFNPMNGTLYFFNVDIISLNNNIYSEYSNKLQEHVPEMIRLSNKSNNDDGLLEFEVCDGKFAFCLQSYEHLDTVINDEWMESTSKIYLKDDLFLSALQKDILESFNVDVIRYPECFWPSSDASGDDSLGGYL